MVRSTFRTWREATEPLTRRWIEGVEQGESFTVTRNGFPVADLMPHDAAASRRQRFVPVDSISAGVSTLPSWDIDRFRREQAGLDEALDDDEVDRWASTR